MRDFASLHAGSWPFRLAGRAGLALLFAALLAFLAPFGTYRFHLLERVGYWTLQMAAWLALSLTASWSVEYLPGIRTLSPERRRVAATALAALPMMVVTGVANNVMIDWQPDAGELIELFLSIALIGGGYTILGDWIAGSIHAPAEPTAARHTEPGTAVLHSDSSRGQPSDTSFIDRLPAHLRAGILCLQVEDHYVRVQARDGSAMVLIRFSDALRGVEHIAGSQVHRSWWVADDAVTELRRTGRTAQLTLRNGARVPVSQPYLAHALQTWGSMSASVS
ncbi:LytTR family DNA-binding domain-containing protein [Sphingomonas sp. 3-13AW]|uniref:LytTR family DNA-binding domain-containing protein n=1 Tax=Sphingomonas sp. 3-13AW TaxID=3050450 RepID=UPI003BB4B5D9